MSETVHQIAVRKLAEALNNVLERKVDWMNDDTDLMVNAALQITRLKAEVDAARNLATGISVDLAGKRDAFYYPKYQTALAFLSVMDEAKENQK